VKVVSDPRIKMISRITRVEWSAPREKGNGVMKGAEIVSRGRTPKFQEVTCSVSMVITAPGFKEQSQGGEEARLLATTNIKRGKHFFFSKESWARSGQDIDDDPGSGQSHSNTDMKNKNGDEDDVMNNMKANEEGLEDGEGLGSKKKTLGNMDGDEGDPSKSDKTESAYMDTQSFFFTLKGGKGNIEDIAKEREFRLNRIRKLHKPMDYKKLKQHELSFMSEILTKRAKKKEEMAIRLKETEQAYKVSYKSKVHNTLEKDYKCVRHGVQV
jgi:hypothetical protein